MARKRKPRASERAAGAGGADRVRERRTIGQDDSGATGLRKTTIFMNGRSQAVRLPKEFRFEGTHVYAMKEGNRVILTPVDDRMEALIALMGSSPEFPDVARDEPEPMRPEIREYFGVSD
jgi:antitoxin VapB